MLKKYATGYILALLLTGISFFLALTSVVTTKVAIAGMIVAAVAQMIVHLSYFLHINRSTEERWNVVSLLFALLLISFFIGGTVWVMFTLNQRMM